MDECDLWNDLTQQVQELNIGTEGEREDGIDADSGVCPSCSMDEFTFNNGKRVCKGCGEILGDLIDQGAEWRCFSDAQGKSTTNSNVRCSDARSPFVPDTLSINTFIRDGDRRLQRVHHFSHTTARERQFAGIQKEFDDITLKFNLPRVIYRTMCELYFKVFTAMQERNYAFQRCNIRKGLIAACLFYACKLNGSPRNSKEIADMLGYTRKCVTKGCNNFTDVLGQEYMNLPPFKPSDFVERFASAFDIEYSTVVKIKEIVMWVEKERIVHESTPSSVAAAVIHFVMDFISNPISYEEMTRTCEVSKAVIQKISGKVSANALFIQEVKRVCSSLLTHDVTEANSLVT